MDSLKSEMMKKVDVGGLKCPCCNFSHHKGKIKKRKLRKIAKARLKAKLQKQLKEEV